LNSAEPVTIKKSFIVTPVLTNKPKLGAIDAVTLPLAILGDTLAGTFINWEPSPENIPKKEPVAEPVNEPVAFICPKNEPVKFAKPVKFPLNEPKPVDAVNSFVINLSLTSTDPVNSCLSVNSSPNLFEPD